MQGAPAATLARKLAVLHSIMTPVAPLLGPPPKKPSKPPPPRVVKDAAENERRQAEYAASPAVKAYERAMEEHRAAMTDRKRATDKRSRPDDDGARAVQRRQSNPQSVAKHAEREGRSQLHLPGTRT